MKHDMAGVTASNPEEAVSKRSEKAALRLARETGVIAEIGRIISSSLEIEEVYERFAKEVSKLVPFDRILVNLLDTQNGSLTTAYASGMVVSGVEGEVSFPTQGSVTQEMIRGGVPILFHPQSIEEVESRYPSLLQAYQAGLRSRLSVPLVAGGEVIGCLALWSKKASAYGERDSRLAQSVAGQIAGAIANARLFRERAHAEEALRESEESYRNLVENSPDAIFLHDGEIFVYLNPAAVLLYGAQCAEELQGKAVFDYVHPDYTQVVRERTRAILTAGTPVPLNEIRIVRLDGMSVDVEATAAASYYHGKKVIQVLQRDITERKRSEEKIKASLKEKEVLLKEIHHRVKNNLQIVSSLLYLQAVKTEHPGAVAALKESRNRIRSMALIHERLYSSPNLASVDMAEYTRKLVFDLRRSHRTEEDSVRLIFQIDDTSLGVNEAIPCGLIINELVSNALKHAFPEGAPGDITIRLARSNGKRIALTVSDNGVGLPEQLDLMNPPTLGLTLVKSIVEQLNGSIRRERNGGTTFTILFESSGAA